MGTLTIHSCPACTFEFGWNEGCGMILPDLEKALAKKRKPVREKAAALWLQRIEPDFPSIGTRLYHFKGCGWLHDRVEISFAYREGPEIKEFRSSEICPKCRKPCDVEGPDNPITCPDCRKAFLVGREAGLWD